MASMLFGSAVKSIIAGTIIFDIDSFKVLLVTSAYTPNKHTHSKRSDVTNEVVGKGYVVGGNEVTVVVTEDINNDRVIISLGSGEWSLATIAARGAVYYKSRGGAASDDELVAYIDFNTDITSTNGTFSLMPSTLRIQN